MQQGLSGAGEARTWLLPALRRHVSGTHMRYWATHLMPLAKEMGQAAGAASQRGNKVSFGLQLCYKVLCFRHVLTQHLLCVMQGLAAACHALEVQLWSCLQAFANWPTDAAEVYPGVHVSLVSCFGGGGHVQRRLVAAQGAGCCELACEQQVAHVAAGSRMFLAGCKLVLYVNNILDLLLVLMVAGCACYCRC